MNTRRASGRGGTATGGRTCSAAAHAPHPGRIMPGRIVAWLGPRERRDFGWPHVTHVNIAEQAVDRHLATTSPSTRTCRTPEAV
ncbi:hypothetical protein ACGF0J_07115 [Nonomuraea sp. NPDC047897]|uniref:hypothetical protein n=1 Tax=Nonomuraea sp. NPDC047897 TaxID=3364346 RepID=UPI00371B3DBB